MAISKKLRQQVYDKFNGLCAYTGKPLEDDWQVDHAISKCYSEQVLIKEKHWLNLITGEELSMQTFNDRHREELEKGNRQFGYDWKNIASKYKPIKENNSIDNLLPALKIINHYKRAYTVDGFRKFMLTFHERLNKLPKKTLVPATVRRIEYMNEIANHFDITIEKPFNGVFYFETLTTL